jgi:hypothetical protein
MRAAKNPFSCSTFIARSGDGSQDLVVLGADAFGRGSIGVLLNTAADTTPGDRPSAGKSSSLWGHRTSNRRMDQSAGVEAFSGRDAKRYLIRDRDSLYGHEFRRHLQSLGMKEVVSLWV